MSSGSATKIFSFNLELALINHLRSFKPYNNDHRFEPGYIESIYAYLFQYQGDMESEMFDDYCQQNGGLSLKQTVLFIHFAFGSIANLKELATKLNHKGEIVDISKSQINKTNILCVHSIMDLQNTIDHQKINELQGQLKPSSLESLKISIIMEDLQYDQETNTLYIPYHILKLGIQAKGKLDIYLTSYIAHILNKNLKLNLFHAHFAFSAKQGKAQVYTENYHKRLVQIYIGVSQLKFDKTNYHYYRQKMVNFAKENKFFKETEVQATLLELERTLSDMIIARDPKLNYYFEKLMIGMLGSPIQVIRDHAVIMLNILYDGVDWSRRAPFSTKISKVKSKFLVDYLIESDQYDENIVFLVKSLIFLPSTRQNVISIHKPKIKEFAVVGNKRYVSVQLDLGRFKRCGFYDWKLVKLMETGEIKSVYKIADLRDRSDKEDSEFTTRPVQGRFIVHPEDSKDLQMHEIFVDLQDGVPDEKGKIVKRGNFRKVKDKLPAYKQMGLNSLYLMGALERDNGIYLDEQTKQFNVKRPEVSPLSITCRSTPNSMLGGKQSFKELTKKASELGMRIIVDCLTRISSSRAHKKYRNLIIHSLDQQGKQTPVFGSDGRAIFFEDTTLLNYRKKKVWDLMIEEITKFTDTYNISGLHLDNGQAWPQIFRLDRDEMYRKDTDGTDAYTEKQIFEGELVEQNEDCGYWATSYKDILPNPFIIKLCRNLWSRYPNFLILCEVWGSFGEQDVREVSVIQSGPIPRTFKIPIALSQIFGENLRKDGTINSIERKTVSVFKKWYLAQREILPQGSFVIQSTTYHTWPYPALLYKKGTWAAVDLFFTLCDIPMTFIGELDGHAFKIKTTNIFSQVRIEQNNESETDLTTIKETEEDPNYIQEVQRKEKKRQSIIQIESQLFLSDEGQGFGWSGYEPRTVSKRKSIVRVSSGQSFDDVNSLNEHTKSFVKSQGDWFGPSLQTISKHYESRRLLRQTKKPLKQGIFIPLLAEHKFGWHTHVIAYCRMTKKQFCVVVINFNDAPVQAYINLKPLRQYFPNYEDSDLVVQMESWVKDEKYEDDQLDHYFIGELINERLLISLHNFHSHIWGFNLFADDGTKQRVAESHSFARFKQSLSLTVPMTIYSNDVASQLIKLLSRKPNLQDFVNGYAYLYNTKLKDVNLNNAIAILRDFQKDNALKCRLFAYFQALINKNAENPKIEEKIEFYKKTQEVVQSNKLGPICFVTPEYAKWTKTGGLGVMTDELTRGLVDLGEDVYVVTPIYDNKLKEKPDLLEKDGFKHTDTISYYIGGTEYQVGIHFGEYKGVKIYFLHNPDMFPAPFAGDDAAYTVKSMALYARVTLELLCRKRIIPALVVGNDWYSGLIPGYIKNKTFGETFSGTKIFHIAHNLDTNYEGRQYPTPEQGDLGWIHELPTHWLVDPYWKNLVVNPSRCAFMTCDNWGTVSHSYKYQLLRESALSAILSNFPNAFSFPNGLNIQERLKMIKDLPTSDDHLKAKEKIQQKYFGFSQLDNSFCLFGFVGRITEQKGIHLILECVEDLIRQSNGKIQIILGGNANYKEEYAQICAEKINFLRNKHPNNFWGDPDLFFRDGPLINVGCDFGLMPSKFEPGGIVQHEFFVGSTPVIAMKTGGLQDTVTDFNEVTEKGSGFTFEHHNSHGFAYAVTKALKLFKNENLYSKLRKSSFQAVIDVSEVSKAYEGEFYRMFNKNFIDKPTLTAELQKIDCTFDIEKYQPQQMVGRISARIQTRETKTQQQFQNALNKVAKDDKKSIQFKINVDSSKLPKQVQIIGSFDNWQNKRPLKYDQFSREWKITLNLPRGDYFYKYIIDDEWICSDDDAKDTDIYGYLNNFISVD
ncbi:hypothetical protein ABPG72_001854 [Tetrahymena utriculariae]